MIDICMMNDSDLYKREFENWRLTDGIISSQSD